MKKATVRNSGSHQKSTKENRRSSLTSRSLLLKLISVTLLSSLLLCSCGKTTNESSGKTETSTTTTPSATTPGKTSNNTYTLIDLTTDSEVTPLGIDSIPLFGWKMTSTGRDAMQKNYRITVSSSEEKLKNGDFDMWDSGKVESNVSTNIKYGGRLNPSTKYFWKVEVECEDGKSATSEETFFETGLLSDGFKDADWIASDSASNGLTNANWIWFLDGVTFDKCPEKTEYFRGKASIDGSKTVSSATLLFTTDDYGEVYINGKSAKSEENVADAWQTGSIVDVTELVKSGENIIAAKATNTSEGYGGFIAKISVQYSDGSSSVFVTDKTWVCSDKEVNGWETESFDSSKWVTPDMEVLYGGSPWNTLVSFASPSPMLRFEFEAEKKVVSARLYASAAGVYDAFINGEKVGEDFLNPGRTELDKRVMYQSFDCTSMIKTGKNAIGAMLGNGWYLHHDSKYGGTSPAFIAKLILTYEDGTNKTVATNKDWKFTQKSPITANNLFNGESYDARLYPDGWDESGFNDIEWQPVTVTNATNLKIGTIVAQKSGTVKAMEKIKAKAVTEPSKGVYIYDFGQNLAGVVSINVTGTAGQVVTMRHAEMLNSGEAGTRGNDGPDGTLYTLNLRTAKATDTYTLKGGEKETYTPAFTYHGFRYVEITGVSEKLALDDVTALVLYSDLTDTGTITTDSENINKLISNTYWGQRGNFLSTPTDCPQRDERMGWTGDAQVFVGTSTYNMNVKSFFEKYITDMNDCQDAGGSYSNVAPDDKRTAYVGYETSGWADAGIIIPWTLYVRYGDKTYLEKYYSNMSRYISFLVGKAGTDYIKDNSWTGDWLSINSNTPINVIDTAFCAYSCDLMSKIATVLGKASDSERFSEHADKFKEAWCKNFLTSDGKTHCDTQTSYVLGLYFDIIPDNLKVKSAEYLYSAVKRSGFKITTGFLGVSLILPTLAEYGYESCAFSLLEQTEYPSWLYPVLQGATTIWERWNSYTESNGFGDASMNSFNHYSYGSVTEWLYSYLAGISADEANPGFKHIILRPTVGGTFKEISATYDSIYGTIESSWKSNDKKVTSYKCTVPANTTATLRLPSGDGTVTESGNSLSEANGITIGEKSDGVQILELVSGEYSFEIKY